MLRTNAGSWVTQVSSEAYQIMDTKNKTGKKSLVQEYACTEYSTGYVVFRYRCVIRLSRELRYPHHLMSRNCPLCLGQKKKETRKKFESGCAINRVVRMLPDPGADSAASHANATRSKGIKSKNAKKILSIVYSITYTPSCYSIKSNALATLQTP